MHDGVPQIEQNEPQEAHDNAGILMETSNSPTTDISKVNRMEIPFYKDPPKGDTCSSVSSIKARYGKPKRETSSEKEKTADSNSNVLPAIKEIKRKGSTVLVSKSRSGETCFQVKTPADLKRSSHTEEITVWYLSINSDKLSWTLRLVSEERVVFKTAQALYSEDSPKLI